MRLGALHVDGAYGGFAALTERGRRALEGIELADSVTLDPHKWLYQPIECGCVLVREGHLLRQAFTIDPDYLADRKSDEVNFSDLGLQLTRTARASASMAAASASGRIRRRSSEGRTRTWSEGKPSSRAARAIDECPWSQT